MVHRLHIRTAYRARQYVDIQFRDHHLESFSGERLHGIIDQVSRRAIDQPVTLQPDRVDAPSMSSLIDHRNVLIVWTGDKGNSQTGDMGDSGTMGARVV